MTCPDEDPNDNAAYAAFLDSCAELCRCCNRCQPGPCPGTLQGGLCDDICYGCDLYEDDRSFEQEDE